MVADIPPSHLRDTSKLRNFKMCQGLHFSFYHNCGHIQQVQTPSANPDCDITLESAVYREGKWCPRCTWKGKILRFVYPREWEEPAESFECKVTGETAQVIRNVQLPPMVELPDNPVEGANEPIDKLWNYRGVWFSNYYWNSHLRREEWFRKLQLTDEWLDKDPRQRTYYLRAPLEQDFNNSPEFYDDSIGNDQLLLDTNPMCSICRSDINVGRDAENSCLGMGFVDKAGNTVLGWPVRIPCGHYFGLGCIRQAFEGTDNVAPTDLCPFCRNVYDFVREAEYLRPEEWEFEIAYDHMTRKEKIDFTVETIATYIYTNVIVWLTWTKWHIIQLKNPGLFARIRYDIWGSTQGVNNWERTKHILIDYLTWFTTNWICQMYPHFMSYTNFLLLTGGFFTFWWTRLRPITYEQPSDRHRLYFWFSFLGNLLEWVLDMWSNGGLFLRWADYAMAVYYVHFLFAVLGLVGNWDVGDGMTFYVTDDFLGGDFANEFWGGAMFAL